MNDVTARSYPSVPDMHLQGITAGLVRAHAGIHHGRLILAPEVVTPLAALIDDQAPVRLAPGCAPMRAGLDAPLQAYLTLRALFVIVEIEEATADIFRGALGDIRAG